MAELRENRVLAEGDFDGDNVPERMLAAAAALAVVGAINSSERRDVELSEDVGLPDNAACRCSEPVGP